MQNQSLVDGVQVLATARETLYEEMVALTAAPAGDDAGERVRKIMLKYRVQTKPGVNVANGQTARDDLGDRLLQLWRDMPAGVHDLIGTEIDKFRMQMKQKSAGGAKPKPAAAKKPAAPARPAAATTSPARPDPAPLPAPEPQMAPVDFDALRPARLEPVAGGPRRRGKTRSECPKCHSMGVVLARSYAGDEYFSCIYCGWQAFKPADENDPTASLAGRLLGQTGKN